MLQKNHYNTQELLTGRKYVYNLFALSLEELYPDKNKLQITKELQNLLIFGTYPEVALQSSFQDKQELLQELSSSYIYKDILEFQQIKYSDILVHLLKVLSLQIGSELFYFKKFLFHDLLHHHPTPTT